MKWQRVQGDFLLYFLLSCQASESYCFWFAEQCMPPGATELPLRKVSGGRRLWYRGATTCVHDQVLKKWFNTQSSLLPH